MPGSVNVPLFHDYPGRPPKETPPKIGSLELLEAGEIRVNLDAIPAYGKESNIIARLRPMPAAERPILQHWPARAGTDSMVPLGRAVVAADGVLTLIFHAFPAALSDSRIVIPAFSPEQQGHFGPQSAHPFAPTAPALNR